MDDVSAEWLHVWPILTHGVARAEAISVLNMDLYPEERWDFFVPIDSVAVFDHFVTGPVLAVWNASFSAGTASPMRRLRR